MNTPLPKLVVAALILVTATAATLLAQGGRTGTIAGRVTARSTGVPIAAQVSIKDGVTVNADAEGSFTLETTPGVYTVNIEAAGFAPVRIEQVGVTAQRVTRLNVELDIVLTADVEVRSEKFAENPDQPVSSTTLRREDLRAGPGTGGDPLRAINTLPGVTSASGEFADLIVRGGTTGENLTYIDNVPVNDFSYFTDQYDGDRGGRASILPPDAFERAEFSAGGFGSKYGDRMSSALDITIREAARERLQGVIFADSGTLGGSLDIPLGKRASWLVSARRSFVDIALDVAGLADAGLIGYPRTFDLTNKFSADLSPRTKLTFTAVNFFERFNQTDEQSLNIDRRTDRLRMTRTSQRHIFGTTLSTSFGSNVLAQTTVYHTSDHNDGTFYIPFSLLQQRARDLRDSRTGIKEDVNVSVNSRLRFAFGGELRRERFDYYTFRRGGTFLSPLEEEFISPTIENRTADSRLSGFAYGQAVINLTNRFSITPGVRVDRYGMTGETLASPRFAARYNAGRVAVTFATGLYRQPPALYQLSIRPENRALHSQSATHIVGGIEWLPREDIRIRGEVFRKRYSNVITVPIGPTPGYVSDGRLINSGEGTASGFEISLQKSLSGVFSGQASYGFIRSERTLAPFGTVIRSDLERPHQLTLIGIAQFWGFNVAAKFRAASGLPYTRREAVPVGSFFIQRIRSAADINALRLPSFKSLDLRAERRFTFSRFSVSPYIDIFNVTNSNKVVQPNYEFFSAEPLFLNESKRLPIFGFRFEF